MALRRFWLLALMASIPVLCLASVDSAADSLVRDRALSEREHRIWSSAVHDSEFGSLIHTANPTDCGAAEPPQALATPDPLLEEADSNSRISVSFIIGTDGRVHSPLILESAGPSEDRTVLDAVRFWRYRPARCNGVPTDAEAKVEFSNR